MELLNDFLLCFISHFVDCCCCCCFHSSWLYLFHFVLYSCCTYTSFSSCPLQFSLSKFVWCFWEFHSVLFKHVHWNLCINFYTGLNKGIPYKPKKIRIKHKKGWKQQQKQQQLQMKDKRHETQVAKITAIEKSMADVYHIFLSVSHSSTFYFILDTRITSIRADA